MINLIATDMDGTLLNAAHEILEENIQVILSRSLFGPIHRPHQPHNNTDFSPRGVHLLP